MKNIVLLLALRLSSNNAALTRTPCLTEEDCKARYTSMNNAGIINGYFYSGSDLPTKGCILKGENFFFGLGGTSEEMTEDDVSGEQQRVWCYVEPALTQSELKASKEAMSMSLSLSMSMSMSLPLSMSMSMSSPLSMSVPLLTELEMSMPVQGKASKEAMSMSLPSLTELDFSMSIPVQGKALKDDMSRMQVQGKASKEALSMSVPLLTELEMSMSMPVQGKASKLPLLTELEMSMSLPFLTELEVRIQGKASKEALSMSVPLLTELEMSMSMPVQGKQISGKASKLPLLTELEMSMMSMPVQGKASRLRTVSRFPDFIFESTFSLL